LNGVCKIVRVCETDEDQPAGVHSLRATAATNAIEHEADIAKVQQ
jgi:integrase/recombinase XerD